MNIIEVNNKIELLSKLTEQERVENLQKKNIKIYFYKTPPDERAENLQNPIYQQARIGTTFGK